MHPVVTSCAHPSVSRRFVRSCFGLGCLLGLLFLLQFVALRPAFASAPTAPLSPHTSALAVQALPDTYPWGGH